MRVGRQSEIKTPSLPSDTYEGLEDCKVLGRASPTILTGSIFSRVLPRLLAESAVGKRDC